MVSDEILRGLPVPLFLGVWALWGCSGDRSEQLTGEHICDAHPGPHLCPLLERALGDPAGGWFLLSGTM